MHLYQYRDHIGKTESKKKANLDLEVLSHMFTKAIEWGVIHIHPMTGKKVTKFSLKSRKVEPIHSEMVVFIQGWPRQWQIYFMLKIWWARRKGEMLRLTKFDISKQGVRFINNKREDDEFIVPWEPETRVLVSELLNLPGAQHNTYLWETRTHSCYVKADGTTSGFDTLWQKRMTRALQAGQVTRRFTEHDLRKVRPSMLNAGQAQELLRHTTGKQTETYRTGAKIVDLGSKK
jgi:integrase